MQAVANMATQLRLVHHHLCIQWEYRSVVLIVIALCDLQNDIGQHRFGRGRIQRAFHRQVDISTGFGNAGHKAGWRRIALTSCRVS